MIRELGDFCIGVAAFPDPHPERHDPDLDARMLLAEKAQAGASFAVTQLFFTADGYFDAGGPGPRAGLRRCRSSRASCR